MLREQSPDLQIWVLLIKAHAPRAGGGKKYHTHTPKQTKKPQQSSHLSIQNNHWHLWCSAFFFLRVVYNHKNVNVHSGFNAEELHFQPGRVASSLWWWVGAERRPSPTARTREKGWTHHGPAVLANVQCWVGLSEPWLSIFASVGRWARPASIALKSLR